MISSLREDLATQQTRIENLELQVETLKKPQTDGNHQIKSKEMHGSNGIEEGNDRKEHEKYRIEQGNNRMEEEIKAHFISMIFQ